MVQVVLELFTLKGKSIPTDQDSGTAKKWASSRINLEERTYPVGQNTNGDDFEEGILL
jgi:hypothetical protein